MILRSNKFLQIKNWVYRGCPWACGRISLEDGGPKGHVSAQAYKNLCQAYSSLVPINQMNARAGDNSRKNLIPKLMEMFHIGTIDHCHHRCSHSRTHWIVESSKGTRQHLLGHRWRSSNVEQYFSKHRPQAMQDPTWEAGEEQDIAWAPGEEQIRRIGYSPVEGRQSDDADGDQPDGPTCLAPTSKRLPA